MELKGFSKFIAEHELDKGPERSFAVWLRKHHLTWYQVHRKTGISKALCFEYSRDIHRPSRRTVERIAAAFKLPLDELLAEIPTRECKETLQHPPSRKWFCVTCRRGINEKDAEKIRSYSLTVQSS